MPGTIGIKKSLGDLMPRLKEGSAQGDGIQQVFTVAMGPPLLVDGVTYRQVAFVAPCNGCRIKEIHCSSVVKIASGTNTLAIDNYDASITTARNVLSTTNFDPDTIPALTELKLTLTTTLADLEMDEGDVLNFTMVCGTQTTAGQGLAMTITIIVPDLQ